jgi:hypothetical protein
VQQVYPDLLRTELIRALLEKRCELRDCTDVYAPTRTIVDKPVILACVLIS